ncbi:MAG: hypothetical protein ACJ779_08270 [Chloroflexota bacterium]
MATAFVITTATNTVLLGAGRTGTAVFTVTNQTGHAVRARATLTAVDPTQAAWLTLAGLAERDYPIGGTEQLSVSVAVPPEAPAGRYPFRLDVVSVLLPDEEWAQGPVVAFEIATTPEPVPVPKPEPVEPRGYVETLAGALLGGIVLGLLLGGIGLGLGLLASGKAVDLSGAIGAIIGAVLLAGFLGFIGMWIGAIAGAGLTLRLRRFAEPWRTALPLGLLFPIWAIVAVVIVFSVSDALNASGGIAGFVTVVLAMALAIAPPALGGRAWARWRKTGGL